MNVQQISLSQNLWKNELETININANIFLLFVSPEFNNKVELLDSLHKKYPKATLIGCSTAGEISDITVKDHTVSLTAIQLEKVTYKKAFVEIRNMRASFDAGQILATELYTEDLKSSPTTTSQDPLPSKKAVSTLS